MICNTKAFVFDLFSHTFEFKTGASNLGPLLPMAANWVLMHLVPGRDLLLHLSAAFDNVTIRIGWCCLPWWWRMPRPPCWGASGTGMPWTESVHTSGQPHCCLPPTSFIDGGWQSGRSGPTRVLNAAIGPLVIERWQWMRYQGIPRQYPSLFFCV